MKRLTWADHPNCGKTHQYRLSSDKLLHVACHTPYIKAYSALGDILTIELFLYGIDGGEPWYSDARPTIYVWPGEEDSPEFVFPSAAGIAE